VTLYVIYFADERIRHKVRTVQCSGLYVGDSVNRL